MDKINISDIDKKWQSFGPKKKTNSRIQIKKKILLS